MSTEKKTCFVVMGFGEKVDFQTGRTLNLDATYKHLIKPAVEEAGLRCVRADEIAHSGVIDVPMYRQLLLADVVVADVSTANANAFYELGVRHALRPHTTVVICEDKFTFPFDINRNKILKYKHLGEDIGASEVERFRTRLRQQIVAVLEKDPPDDDSPVYTFLQRLRRLKLPDDLESHGGAVSAEFAAEGAPPPEKTHGALIDEFAEAKRQGDFETARTLLATVRKLMRGKNPDKPEDPYIIQQLALVTYKSERPTPLAALEEARDLLRTLNPETSNDTETLGLWGAVHKRLWDLLNDEGDAEAAAHLDQAVRGYERGFYLRNDYYNGINLAYVLNVRAANAASPEEAVADFVQARRVCAEVVRICDEWLAETGPPHADATEGEIDKYNESKYWVLATLAEAYVRLGDEARAQDYLRQAHELNPPDWMKATTREQLANLRGLLADSPLKYVRTDAA